ncbi:MAG TPA: hypothetical protein PLH91_00570 [Tenuifilaceae bacterium]|nr:hypothetical protein [Tenuifilaceae bacterium]
MNPIIFRNNWHLLTGEQIISLFKEQFTEVTIEPNFAIVQRLKMLEVATLELMENRSRSTVYRIKQYDEVYQIFEMNGDYFIYDTEDYYNAEIVDKLLKSYIKKEPVFTISEVSKNRMVVERLKPPRFCVTFEGNESKNVVWIDKEPDNVSTIANLMRKAGAFYASYKRR